MPNSRDDDHRSNREQGDGYQDERDFDDRPLSIVAIGVGPTPKPKIQEPYKGKKDHGILDNSWRDGSVL